MIYSNETPTLYELCNYYGYTINTIFGNYPIWNENERAWLNESLFNHFAYRTIAQDTPAQFVFFLQRKLKEVMPTYNPMFADLEKAKPSVTNWQNSRALVSTTPQTQLSGNENYADGMQDTYIEGGGNIAQALQSWYLGVNNALVMLYTELEGLFYQFWEVN